MKAVTGNNDKLIWGFVILNMITGTAGGILQVLIPLFAVSLQASTAQVGLVKGASSIGMLLLVLPAGFLIDRYGSRRLFIVGSVLSGLIILGTSKISLPFLLILAMFVYGFANSIKLTSVNAAFFKHLKQVGLGRAGWYKGSISIGLTFLGPFLGGFTVSWFSYPVNFILVGLLTLVPVLLVMTLAPGRERLAGSRLPVDLAKELSDFKRILKNPIIRQTVFAESLSTACFSSFATFIIIQAVNQFHLTVSLASWLVIVEGGAFIMTVFLAGQLIAKFPYFHLYLGSFILTIVGLLSLGFASTIAVLVLGTLIIGLGLGMTNLITYSQVGEMEGEKGKIAGLFAACTGLGAATGPIVGGMIGQTWGIPALFLSYIPAFILLGIYLGSQRFAMLHKDVSGKAVTADVGSGTGEVKRIVHIHE